MYPVMQNIRPNAKMDPQYSGYFDNAIGSTYSDSSVLDLSFLSSQHDLSNVQTLDVSGNAKNAEFGDGVTPTTYPTKLGKRGYSFDGGDYLKVPSANLKFEGPTEDFTIALALKSSASAIELIVDMRDGASDGWRIIKVNDQIWFSLNAININPGSVIPVGTSRTIIIPVNRSGTTRLTVDGVPTGINVDTSGVTMSIAQAHMHIGRQSFSASSFYNGDIYELRVFPFLLSATQATELHLKMLNGMNDI